MSTLRNDVVPFSRLQNWEGACEVTLLGFKLLDVLLNLGVELNCFPNGYF